MRLQSIRVRNFKAIVDSKTVRFGPLTVFIGNNGAGKSSLIEALETYQSIVRDGLDIAMQRWLGIEHARHKAQEIKELTGTPASPMEFDLWIGKNLRQAKNFAMAIESDSVKNKISFADEHIAFKEKQSDGEIVPVKIDRKNALRKISQLGLDVSPNRSLVTVPIENFSQEAEHILNWQFLTLAPERMGLPIPQQRTGGNVRLARDGSNIADVLLDIRRQDLNAFEGIVETLAYVLPYAKDLQPAITAELERKAWLQLTEADFKVPGWMLSSGTLRLLALLALLRHPKPPPLIIVEEIENGLDPRSIHLLVEEIRTAVLNDVTQVICTTHSPYLLDLLTLDHLILVERDKKGQPRFIRPADNARLKNWTTDFAPGKLYTMGSLTGSDA